MNIDTTAIGTSWVTWETRDLLAKAESLFGPRDKNFEFLGISFDPTGPRIRFSPCETKVCVELSSAAIIPDNIRYQAAHEVIHLLAPTTTAPMLEEGLAVWFSLNGPPLAPAYKDLAFAHLKSAQEEKNYLDAFNVYSELKSLDGDCVAKLRAEEPCFAKMTPSLIRYVLPSTPEDLAKRCCEFRVMR